MTGFSRDIRPNNRKERRTLWRGYRCAACAALAGYRVAISSEGDAEGPRFANAALGNEFYSVTASCLACGASAPNLAPHLAAALSATDPEFRRALRQEGP